MSKSASTSLNLSAVRAAAVSVGVAPTLASLSLSSSSSSSAAAAAVDGHDDGLEAEELSERRAEQNSLHPMTYYNGADYIETLTSNKIHLRSSLLGSKRIHLKGKVIVEDGVIIRGDLASIKIGRFCRFASNTVIRPTFKLFKGKIAYFPSEIGDFVTVGRETVLEAAVIGSHVKIGPSCVIMRGCVLKDCCSVAPNSVLPPDTVVPPNTHYGGQPARYVRNANDGVREERVAAATIYFDNFKALRK